MRPKNLIIDCDDTLWENNRFFMEAHTKFVRLMEGLGHDPSEADRLLLALEEFVLQEEILLRERAFDEIVDLREHAAPVAEKLCELAVEFTIDSVFRLRLEDLLHRSGQNFRLLTGELARRQEELTRVGEALGRLRRVAPAYKTAGRGMESRLNAAA